MDASDVTTARLALRPWSPDELAAVPSGARMDHWAEDFPAEGDVVIAGFVADRPNVNEYGQRQVIERSTGLVVGSIGLFWPPTDGALEIGYGIVPSRRGLGYASEAARALALFALAAPGVHTVCAEVELANPASVRVLEKAGFRSLGDDGTTARFGVQLPDLNG
ncbi:GNAT family N-acetyltransferase [Streptodolium elevatio]|uniref:GNAT family N-acetyltransferase n=1 Tax=Streptodolium elevatio TaxID=3157996 RepID=A0ABV3DQT8_9ACTN